MDVWLLAAAVFCALYCAFNIFLIVRDKAQINRRKKYLPIELVPHDNGNWYVVTRYPYSNHQLFSADKSIVITGIRDSSWPDGEEPPKTNFKMAKAIYNDFKENMQIYEYD